MQVLPITSQTQNFKAKPFRLPVKDYTKPNTADLPFIHIKEYANPNAENLYNQALKTKDFYKKLSLIRKMGEYRLIDVKEVKTQV